MSTSARLTYDPAADYDVDISDHPYRTDGDRSWLVRVYQPQGPGPFPMIVDVHGGHWTLGDRTQNALIDTALARSGIVVAALDFRLGPADPYPGQVQDVNYGTRWLKAHAAEFNASPDLMGGLGTSSGGHSVMLSALRPHDPRYAAISMPEAPNADASLTYVFSLWGVLCPYTRYRYAQNARREDLIHGSEGYFITEEAMVEASPVMALETGEKTAQPSVLILQGTDDANVPLEIPRRFVAAYEKAGGPIQIEWFEGAPHGFGRTESPHTTRAIQAMKAFVAGMVG